MKYFAYGSNLNPARMKQRGVEFTSREAAVLHGYQLVFDKKASKSQVPEAIAFANIRPVAGEHIDGALYEISTEGAEQLDTWERAPDHYFRTDITVSLVDTEVDCFTYQAREEMTSPGLVPSRNYLSHILEGRDVLSADYVRYLESFELYNKECAACHRIAEAIFVREGERLFVLCAACREARTIWSDTLGRSMTILETEAVMQYVTNHAEGFNSVRELMIEAAAAGLV